MTFTEADRKVKQAIIESVLDTPRDKLNPAIWNDDKTIKPELEQQVMADVRKFLKGQKIESIHFQGSNTGYQYNDTTDIDIHIRIDGLSDEEANDLYDQMPKGVNLKGTTHPINYYIYSGDETKGTKGKGAIYDLLNDKWIIEPEKEDVKVPYNYLLNISDIFMLGIDGQIARYENSKRELEIYNHEKEANTEDCEDGKKEIDIRIAAKEQEIEANLDSLVLIANMLWDMRTNSYKTDKKDLGLFIKMSIGNTSIQNMIYKLLEKFGYKEKLGKYFQVQKKLKAEEEK
jgi:hypothetical protein